MSALLGEQAGSLGIFAGGWGGEEHPGRREQLPNCRAEEAGAGGRGSGPGGAVPGLGGWILVQAPRGLSDRCSRAHSDPQSGKPVPCLRKGVPGGGGVCLCVWGSLHSHGQGRASCSPDLVSAWLPALREAPVHLWGPIYWNTGLSPHICPDDALVAWRKAPRQGGSSQHPAGPASTQARRWTCIGPWLVPNALEWVSLIETQT